jgi:hypothetical protein
VAESTSPSVGCQGTRSSAADDAEALVEHRAERLDLHLTEAGQRLEVRAELRSPSAASRPDAARVAAVLVADVHCELVHARRHRSREAMDRGLLAEGGVEVGVGERGGVDRADAFAHHERTRERLLHGHLLVEREADQERHRVGGDQLVRLVGVGEVEAVGHVADRSFSHRDEG